MLVNNINALLAESMKNLLTLQILRQITLLFVVFIEIINSTQLFSFEINTVANPASRWLTGKMNSTRMRQIQQLHTTLPGMKIIHSIK